MILQVFNNIKMKLRVIIVAHLTFFLINKNLEVMADGKLYIYINVLDEVKLILHNATIFYSPIDFRSWYYTVDY